MQSNLNRLASFLSLQVGSFFSRNTPFQGSPQFLYGPLRPLIPYKPKRLRVLEHTKGQFRLLGKPRRLSSIPYNPYGPTKSKYGCVQFLPISWHENAVVRPIVLPTHVMVFLEVFFSMLFQCLNTSVIHL